jgi:hypothetical protein
LSRGESWSYSSFAKTPLAGRRIYFAASLGWLRYLGKSGATAAGAPNLRACFLGFDPLHKFSTISGTESVSPKSIALMPFVAAQYCSLSNIKFRPGYLLGSR